MWLFLHVQALWLELYQNNDYINAAYGHTASRYADAGNCAILHLHKDDTVYIKGRNEYGVDLYGSPDQIYNTFSGSLLSPTILNKPGLGNMREKYTSFRAMLYACDYSYDFD